MDLLTARTELKTFLETEKNAFLEKPGFAPLEETICRKVDDIVLQIWGQTERLNTKGFALLAIGGFLFPLGRIVRSDWIAHADDLLMLVPMLAIGLNRLRETGVRS